MGANSPAAADSALHVTTQTDVSALVASLSSRALSTSPAAQSLSAQAGLPNAVLAAVQAAAFTAQTSQQDTDNAGMSALDDALLQLVLQALSEISLGQIQHHQQEVQQQQQQAQQDANAQQLALQLVAQSSLAFTQQQAIAQELQQQAIAQETQQQAIAQELQQQAIAQETQQQAIAQQQAKMLHQQQQEQQQQRLCPDGEALDTAAPFSQQQATAFDCQQPARAHIQAHWRQSPGQFPAIAADSDRDVALQTLAESALTGLFHEQQQAQEQLLEQQQQVYSQHHQLLEQQAALHAALVRQEQWEQAQQQQLVYAEQQTLIEQQQDMLNVLQQRLAPASLAHADYAAQEERTRLQSNLPKALEQPLAAREQLAAQGEAHRDTVQHLSSSGTMLCHPGTASYVNPT